MISTDIAYFLLQTNKTLNSPIIDLEQKMLENLRRSHQYRARSSRCTRYRTSGPVFSYSMGSKKVVYRLRGVYETSMSKFAGPELFSLHRSNKMYRCSRTGPLSESPESWCPDTSQNRNFEGKFVFFCLTGGLEGVT